LIVPPAPAGARRRPCSCRICNYSPPAAPSCP